MTHHLIWIHIDTVLFILMYNILMTNNIFLESFLYFDIRSQWFFFSTALNSFFNSFLYD